MSRNSALVPHLCDFSNSKLIHNPNTLTSENGLMGLQQYIFFHILYFILNKNLGTSKKPARKRTKKTKEKVKVELTEDILIDVLRFFNREELASAQLSNRLFNRLILRYFPEYPLMFRHLNFLTGPKTLCNYEKIPDEAFTLGTSSPKSWKSNNFHNNLLHY